MPNASGQGGAIAGTNIAGGRGKFNAKLDAGIWAKTSCLDFCDWRIKNGPNGVDNPKFGWCNISQPQAHYKSVDTLCIGKRFNINAIKSLNETGYSVTVCLFDTIDQKCIKQVASIIDNGTRCLAGLYVFTPMQTGYYQVRLIVHNDCNQTDTFTKIVYVPNLPVASFTMPSSICPGIGTLQANGSASTSNINKCKHRWTIEPIIEDSMNLEALLGLQGNRDWFVDSLSAVSSNFNFPGYKFTGGIRYLVSLTVWGLCSDSTIWDTLDVPLKVNIKAHFANAYSNPLGKRTIQLEGTVIGTTNWNWSPTAYLDNPYSLTPIASLDDSIRYILTGTLGSCTASDTMQIKFKRYAYAGEKRPVCYNQSQMILGTDANGIALLGLLAYVGGNNFLNTYERYYNVSCSGGVSTSATSSSNCLEFDDKFSHFVLNEFPQIMAGSYSGCALFNAFYTDATLRQIIFTDPTFIEFYKNALDNNMNPSSISKFISTVGANSKFSNYLNTLGISLNNGYFNNDGESILNYYDTWYRQSQFLEVTWEKQVSPTSWNRLNSENDDWVNWIVQVGKSNYRITVIDNQAGVVEIDTISILPDTIVKTKFEIAYQADSTIYFTNTSITVDANTTYVWNFGDGTTSSYKHASHTFPLFNKTYWVCLTVTNICGSYQYCDSVRVDSNGLVQNGFNKQSTNNGQSNNENSGEIVLNKTALYSSLNPSQVIKNEIALDNIPNPFSDNTSISYAIGKEYRNAELRVTDVLGRLIKTYSLRSMQGQVDFDGINYKGGLYYSILIIDGVIAKTKTILIER